MSVKLDPLPVPTKTSIYDWAVSLTKYMRGLEREVVTPAPKSVQLEHRRVDAKATTDGLIMWCSVTGAPIVSKGGQWYPMTLGAALPIVGIQKN